MQLPLILTVPAFKGDGSWGVHGWRFTMHTLLKQVSLSTEHQLPTRKHPDGRGCDSFGKPLGKPLQNFLINRRNPVILESLLKGLRESTEQFSNPDHQT